MHPPAVRTDCEPFALARLGAPRSNDSADERVDDRTDVRADDCTEDWAEDAAEALDMALAARRAGVPDAAVAAAFGAEAARLSHLAGALDGQAPPLPMAGTPFVAALESRLGQALDTRRVRPMHIATTPKPTTHRLGLLARGPVASELVLAAAVTVALGVAAVRDGWRPAPALAATPTTTIHRTQTPLGPTGTATGRMPAAMATSEPVAMAGGASDVGW